MAPSAAGFAGALMAANALQRLLTFSLNTALLRFVSADVFGFAANDMELLLSSILFIAREPVRLVALRASADVLERPAQRQQLINLAWLPVVAGCTLACLAAIVTITTEPLDEQRFATRAYCLAAAVEALSEPLYILNQVLGRMRGRAAVETGATLLRVVVTFAAVALLRLGPSGFAAGQLAFAIATLVGYAWSVAGGLRSAGLQRDAATGNDGQRLGLVDMLPALRGVSDAGDHPQPGALGRWLGLEPARLLPAFAAQSVVKHLLTEGDRIVLTTFATQAERGAYAVVQNYGSLAARLVFQPLEEATRAISAPLFARAAAAAAAPARPPGEAAAGNAPPPPQQQQPLQVARDLVAGMLFLVLLLGLFVVALGPGAARSVVALALGRHWVERDVPRLLAAYCAYVLCMAANGVTEAAAIAAADTTRVAASTAQMCGFFALYACIAAGAWHMHYDDPQTHPSTPPPSALACPFLPRSGPAWRRGVACAYRSGLREHGAAGLVCVGVPRAPLQVRGGGRPPQRSALFPFTPTLLPPPRTAPRSAGGVQLRALDVLPRAPLLALFGAAAATSLACGGALGVYGPSSTSGAHAAMLGASAALAAALVGATAALEPARLRRCIGVLRAKKAD